MSGQYNTLILSGGSIRTVCELGAIQYYNDNKRLDSINLYISVSASSIIAYLLIVGYTPIELLNIVCSHPLFTTDIPLIDMVSLLRKDGGISFTPIRDLLEKLTIDKLGMIPTLGKLKQITGIDFVISTFNYDKKRIEYLTPQATPDIPCIVGIQMSCALPFIFKMYKYMGNRYMDSGVIESIPLGYLNEMRLENRRILSIVIEPYLYNDPEDTSDIYPLFHNILSIPSLSLLQYQLAKYNKLMDTVHLSIDTHFLNYYLNTKEKFEMFTFGYHQAQLASDPESVETPTESGPSKVENSEEEEAIEHSDTGVEESKEDELE